MVSGNTFTSLHNHIKITTKLYSNHHSEPLEIKLNGSSTTMELKKKPTTEVKKIPPQDC